MTAPRSQGEPAQEGRAGEGASDPARDAPAQQGPPECLADFPVRRVSASTHLYRSHLRHRGLWWFSSTGGRFDLPAPRGTCYLATSAGAALRERLGPVLARRVAVPATTLRDVVVSRVPVGQPGERGSVRLANLRVAGAAPFGVTRELESMTPYEMPVRWAVAFDKAGLEGIRYGPRFSPGRSSAIALFGPAGEDRERPVDAHPVSAAQVRGAPALQCIPRRNDLTVIKPPRRLSRSR